MAKKIYDFLPDYLKNSELETIFETTLERVFSTGKMEKTKAFVGRKEKGIYNSKDSYLTFPATAYTRDNYGLEPTFTNVDASDNIFYDDLLNSLYNKGALTNDHRRLFKSTKETVQLPIDLDKFVNYSMYYWVSPGFDSSITGSTKKHYVTIDKKLSTDTPVPTDFWKTNNSWYHYDDIKSLITDSNFTLISQALRPIIEFDKNIELSDTSAATTVASSFTVPEFKSYNTSNVYLSDIKIFHYVTGSIYPNDTELGMRPKEKAGDYNSEYVFNIDLPETSTYKLSTTYKPLYTTTVFDYRNFRQEIGDKISVSKIELLQTPKNSNTIDLYVDGQKQVENYTYDSADDTITMTEEVSGNIYVDYCTDTSVIYDGQEVFQRIDPSVEYNIDNKTYYNTEITYSVVFEHFVRIIETVTGLTGSPIANNNYRTSGTNTDKLRFANQGSILIRNTVDIKEAYFALTREDYNPIKGTEFLSGAYNGYKNKLITTILTILESSASTTKTDLEILEEAIGIIALGKQSSVSIFKDSTMLNFGENFSHYQTLDATVIANATEQVMPSFTDSITNDKDVVVILNDIIQRLNIDYTLSSGATEINFTSALSAGDTLTVRHYTNIKETYIPPSATSLKIAPAYEPTFITDSGYSPSVSFIQGHDGSLIPKYNTRTDNIILAFETLVFNNLSDNTHSDIDSMNYGLYGTSYTDYSNSEKKFIMYPFFKKWLMRNGIDSLDNDSFDSTELKTWNYRAKNETVSGYWRGQLLHAYGTDRPLQEPWKAIKLSQKPANFDTFYGSDYTLTSFWSTLINTNSLTCPIPVDGSGNLKTPSELFFGSVSFSNEEIELMKQSWEFGDNSPIELAWTRSSEFAFAEFMLMMLSNPFKVIYDYSTQIQNIISYSNNNEGVNTAEVVALKSDYTFKLGSKLGGFVNNFKLQSENNSLANSRFTELPSDNFDLVVHAGVPNRSEFFSAIVLEKVSLDLAHPVYSLSDVATYYKGLVVLNTGDGKYYKRKIDGVSTKESGATINFDYASWTQISQPKTNKFGFKVHGYDEINPTFYSMGWDKASGEKAFTTAGDKLTLTHWQSGEYYRTDTYILYNDVPYICLDSHTSTTIFDDDIKKWKALTEWPTTNKTLAKGYNELVDDTIKNYNYGDILETVDDVAHLIIGYEHYLKLLGWEFTDTNEFGEVIDWENLLYKFLEWQTESHDIGDFITLTPLLTGGSFNSTNGVASITSETFKNFYRVIDASGRVIPKTELTIHTDGTKISFTSTVPIYGMKVDIRDIEHAFVVDRVDSYGDIIYDPYTHTRNLRMQIDCNRTVDWDGTMSIDGYIVSNNELIPNFDTMIEETRHYRNTVVDQGISMVNKLKSNHYGYTTRPYLSNHGVERESQLEFYKGFLSHKGTVSSIDKIINNNGNFKNITHNDIWAIKLSDYGRGPSNLTMTKDITVNDMVSDPFLIEYDTNKPLITSTEKNSVALRTTGYVDESDVNYVTDTHVGLTDLASSKLYEGDTAWVQFDTDRDWDVMRLSEVSEISYIGETSDNQLYIGMVTEISTSYTNKAIYIKISSDNVDPNIAGYYLLSANGTKTVGGNTIYEYLVFEEDFEPLIVEIDSETTNSVFVPTNTDSGVEAIGSVSNPVFTSGDTIYIDGVNVSYVPSSASASGISILGTVANPVVSEGEQASFVIYNNSGLVANSTNTTVTFSGTVANTTGSFTSTVGDEVTIDGTTLTVDYSGSQSISLTSSATEDSHLTTGNTVTIDGVTKTVADLEVTGTVSSPVMTATKPLVINGDTITLTSGDDLTAIVDAINGNTTKAIASNVGNNLVLTTSLSKMVLNGGVLIDLGLSTTNLYEESKLQNLATEINTISNITCSVATNMTIASSGSSMVISGTALPELGITPGTYNANDDPTQTSVVNQINALNILGVTASVVTGTIKVTSTNHNLDIVEVTAGAMSRLGYATTTVSIDATDTIVSDLNTQVFQGVTTTVSKSDRQVLITSSESSIVTSNISGNPLSDIGISSGTFTNTSVLSSSAVDFASQITAGTDVVVSVSSDGRMIFTNDNVSMTFSGTSDTILTKIGLRLEYSNVTSSANFKAMIWKSLRYTPNFNGTTFSNFATTLGLNSESKLWVDDYDASGWAVLNFKNGAYSIYARQAATINTDFVKRIIVKDGENFTNHSLYDPLNLKMPGAITSKLEYVAWNDPAKYDVSGSSDIWLDEKLGKIWWDTDLARFYRYNDYGDSNGNINTNYAKKYWGKLVANSNVVVNKWTKSRTIPTLVESYNTKTYYDVVAGKEVTDYFFWSSDDDDCKEIAMLINSEGPKNKFLPVGTKKVIISNNATTYDNSTISTTFEYQQDEEVRTTNSDWELLSKSSDYSVPKRFLTDMIESLAGNTIKETYTGRLTSSQLSNPQYALIPISWITDLIVDDNLVVTIDSMTVRASDLSIAGSDLKISRIGSTNLAEGDVLRVYKLGYKEDNWFSDTEKARNNFTSIINEHMGNKMLTALYTNYEQYVDTSDIIFSLGDWYIDKKFKSIDAFSYLSTIRNFDMIAEYNKGIKSFKLKLPTHDEYYFEHLDILQLVNRSKSALNISLTNLVFPEESFNGYYANAVGVQIHELMNLIQDYPDTKFINDIFFGMVQYLYTEKTYPEWLFKTSYIDLNLYNRDLKQYAVYQRDSEQDVLDYIKESKPYHVKIREISRTRATEDTVDATTTISENMNITIDIGNGSRYDVALYDGNASTDIIDDGVYEQGSLIPKAGKTFEAGFFEIGTQYQIQLVGTTDFTLIGSADNDIGTQFVANGVGTGTGKALEIGNRFYPTQSIVGFDSGQVGARTLESSTLMLQRYTGDITGGIGSESLDKTEFYVYDIQGRGYSIAVSGTDTISSFTGDTIVVNTSALFDDSASTDNRKLIAVQKAGTNDIEFMMYDNIDTTTLNISDRTLYSGLGYNFSNNDTVYVLETPMQLVRNNDKNLENLL